MKNDFWRLEAAKNSINDGSNCYSDSRSAAAPTSINFKMKMKKKKKISLEGVVEYFSFERSRPTKARKVSSVR